MPSGQNSILKQKKPPFGSIRSRCENLHRHTLFHLPGRSPGSCLTRSSLPDAIISDIIGAENIYSRVDCCRLSLHSLLNVFSYIPENVSVHFSHWNYKWRCALRQTKNSHVLIPKLRKSFPSSPHLHPSATAPQHERQFHLPEALLPGWSDFRTSTPVPAQSRAHRPRSLLP